MKAVNLIPKESRSTRTIKTGTLGPGHLVLGLLLVAVAFVTIYVLTDNTVQDRQAKLAALQAEVSRAQAVASSLQAYTAYELQVQQRDSDVRSIVAARFDWDGALSELSRVIPAHTSLTSLLGTVVPQAQVTGGAGGGNTSGLRSDILVPAFQLSGCTSGQVGVAALMSRLRLMNAVTRVTLADAGRTGQVTNLTNGGGAAANTGSSPCGSDPSNFDLVVFYTAIPNAGPQGPVALGSTGAVGSTSPTPTGSSSTATSGGAQ